MNNRIGIYFAYWTHEWDADFIYYINKVARLGFDTLEICPGNLVNLPKETCLDIRKAAGCRRHRLDILHRNSPAVRSGFRESGHPAGSYLISEKTY